MGKFIDSDKLIWQVQNNDKYGTITKQVFISLLQNSETEDVAPVVHAHWEPSILPILQVDWLRCSHCKADAIQTPFDMPAKTEICPCCGAMMDGDPDA